MTGKIYDNTQNRTEISINIYLARDHFHRIIS